jgi:Restriction endonuclease
MQSVYDLKSFRDQIKKQTKAVEELTYDGLRNLQRTLAWGELEVADRYFLPTNDRWLNPEELLRPPETPVFPEVGPVPKSDAGLGVKMATEERERLLQIIEAKRRAFHAAHDIEVDNLVNLCADYSMEKPEALVTLIELADKRHPLSSVLKGVSVFVKARNAIRSQLSLRMTDGFRAVADSDAKVVLVDLRFPDFSTHQFQMGHFKDHQPKYASDAEKKRLIRKCLYSIAIRAGYLASLVLKDTSYRTVAVNVTQSWFDPATGAPRSGVICSLLAQVRDFAALELSQVDPEVCFRHFKGIATPSFDSISPVRPILVLNKNDERFIAAKDLGSLLEHDENLAAMPWEDFEHLVAQLFEWEFAKEGVEVRVTRASRDRGVDAILFDPDPLRGGKFVLQAKRYTKPVDVAAVRDLYGTVMNEGANRGILITTSSYGPDAYEFAKNKPLSLVDGPNLLRLLQQHGKRFRIDLEEARRLYRETEA